MHVVLRVADLRRGDEPPAPTRFALSPEVMDGAKGICDRVRAGGDAALAELTREHDGADVAGRIRVPGEEIESAATAVDQSLRSALESMADRLRDLHSRQLPRPWEEEKDGVMFGEVARPLESVGCYVPGGRASYPSSVLMTVVPASVAGVGRIALCSPPAEDGSIPPATLFAASIAGIYEVHRVGGAQAIAALAYGTESIPAVDKIVGPGNVWVTAAKREVAGVVGIDGLAGPTELVVVADGTADPEMIAADMVAQAEHDPLARTVLIALDETLPARVEAALEGEAGASPRREIVTASLGEAIAVIAQDEPRAAAVVNRIAPEHLQIVTADPRTFLERCRSYGAAFLGPFTPVAFGDYGLWANHVLPTFGTARFASGLRAADFVTVSTVLEASAEAAARFGPEAEAVAEVEGLPGHARSSAVRRRAL